MLLHHEPEQLDWIGTWLAPLQDPSSTTHLSGSQARGVMDGTAPGTGPVRRRTAWPKPGSPAHDVDSAPKPIRLSPFEAHATPGSPTQIDSSSAWMPSLNDRWCISPCSLPSIPATIRR